MTTVIMYFAAAISLVSYAPYLHDIVRGRTKPNVITWLTWTALTVVAAIAAFVSNEQATGWLLLASSCGSLSIAILGAKYGTAKMGRLDVMCLIAIGVALLLWYFLRSPSVAVVIVVVIDGLGLVPTINHAFRAPDEETRQCYALSALAAVLTISVIAEYTVASLLYPIYLVTADGIVTAIILWRKRVMTYRLHHSA